MMRGCSQQQPGLSQQQQQHQQLADLLLPGGKRLVPGSEKGPVPAFSKESAETFKNMLFKRDWLLKHLKTFFFQGIY